LDIFSFDFDDAANGCYFPGLDNEEELAAVFSGIAEFGVVP